MFDLDSIILHFGVINLKYYLGELPQKASKSELRNFKKKVKLHQKKSKFIQAFHYVPSFSVHDVIISAINYELLKRSIWYYPYKLLLPIRKKLISWFSGIDLKEHPYCGTLYVPRQNRKIIFHIKHQELIKWLSSFWCNNWANILITASAVGVLILAIINYIQGNSGGK